MGRTKQSALFEMTAIDDLYYEKRLFEKGVKLIAGVDEVGRGCLAGPVVAAAVIFPFPCTISGIKDSKKLTAKKREELYPIINREAVAVSFGIVSSDEIDEINILNASLKAMKLAVMGLEIRPEYLLIDGSYSIPYSIPQLPITGGDSKSISVGAASIMAKVYRDRMMADYEGEYSGYSFSVHKGYGTVRHLSEIRENGPSAIHRKTFRGVIN